MTPPAERRTAVIMGASSGIGRATAEAFAKKGWSLVLAARSREDLEIVASHCRTLDAQVLVVPTDVGDAEAVRALAEVARDFTGKVDLWFSNVRCLCPECHLERTREQFGHRARSPIGEDGRSEEHTSELQSLMRRSYAVCCLKKQKYAI